MKKKSKETLHILTRVSTKPQGDQYSLGIQKEQGIDYSKRLGMKSKVYIEKGVSGNLQLEERKVLSEIMRGVKEGKVKHLWVKDLSRLSRNTIVSGICCGMMNEQGTILYTESGKFDFSSNPYDKFMYEIFSSVYSFQRTEIKRKSMEGKVRHFISGGFRGGTFPFGYESLVFEGKKMLFINKDEREWVEKIFTWYDNGKSPTWIGEQLDSNGIKPRRSKFWNIGTIQKILKNDLYIGRDEMVDKITNPQKPKKLYYQNERLRIVDNELFFRVHKRTQTIRQLKNSYSNRIKHNVVLRGKVECGSCGLPFKTRIKPEKWENYLYCPSKEYRWKNKNQKYKDCDVRRSINIPQTEEIIWNTLCEILERSHIIREQIKGSSLSKKLNNEKDVKREKRRIIKEIKDVDKLISGMDTRITELYKTYTIGNITKIQLKEIEQDVLDEKRKLTDKVSGMRLEIQNLTDKIGWVDWLNKHKNWITDLSSIKDYKGRVEVLNQYLDKVIVSWDPNKQKHKFRLRLKLPIIKDKYIKKGKNYSIEQGEFSTKRGYYFN